MKTPRLGLLPLMIPALLGGCGSAQPSGMTPPDPLRVLAGGARPAEPLALAPIVRGSSVLAGLVVSTGDLRPAFSSDTTDYALTSLNTLFPVSVTATLEDPTAALAINGQPALDGVPLKLTLKPREDLVVVVTGTNAAPRTWRVHALPTPFPGLKVTAHTSKAGDEPVLLNAGSTLFAVDRDGAPIFYRQIPAMRAIDFQQHLLPGGAVYYSYSGIDAVDPLKVQTHLLGQTFEDLGTLALLPYGHHAAHPCDPHDFVLLGDQHYLLMAYVDEVVDLSGLNPKWGATTHVDAAVVQELDHGQVVFEWDSTDHPSLFFDSVESNGFTGAALFDYLHMNSVQVDPKDQNLILSMRHTDSVIKVDRHTGAILWNLGGRSDEFGLAAAQRFSHQHHARLQADGALLLFDNGNNLHQSRVISFALDEPRRQVTGFSVIYERPAGQPQTTFMGSASQLSGGRTLIGWGGWEPASVTPPAVTEVVAGEVVWALTFATPTTFSYRALPLRAP